MNRLYFGDNLGWLRNLEAFPDKSVDLIYLDPPFNSNADYNVLFREQSGEVSRAQFHAFTDTWNWADAAETYNQFIDSCPNVAVVEMMEAFFSFLKTSPMMAYLAMMAPRLVELQRVLKPIGTIYLHCDPTAGHYLKILMDAVFGAKKFLNEIIWCYDTGGRSTSSFPRKHDTILRYSGTESAPFYYDQVALPRDPTTMHETVQKDEEGRPYQRNIKAGKEYRYYLDKGVLPNDWWTDLPALNPAAKERLGYPTQKPLVLLERIIQASSKPGDVILDPFCGCGTTIHAAQKLNREWAGIDITYLAINLVKRRLRDAFGETFEFEEKGQPTDFNSATRLAELDKFQFQQWALSLVHARPLKEGEGKGADRGVDGLLRFYEAKNKRSNIIVQVKGGGVKRSDVATLLGDVNNQKAAGGVLITLEPPTKPMRTEAAAAGRYESKLWHRKDYPKIQILTIEDLISGKERVDAPPPDDPFSKASREDVTPPQPDLPEQPNRISN